jgi:hypothetical protein
MVGIAGYIPTEHLTFLAGVGIELEVEENFGVIRIGLEPSIEIIFSFIKFKKLNEIQCIYFFGGFKGLTSILLGNVLGCIFNRSTTICPRSSIWIFHESCGLGSLLLK